MFPDAPLSAHAASPMDHERSRSPDTRRIGSSVSVDDKFLHLPHLLQMHLLQDDLRHLSASSADADVKKKAFTQMKAYHAGWQGEAGTAKMKACMVAEVALAAAYDAASEAKSAAYKAAYADAKKKIYNAAAYDAAYAYDASYDAAEEAKSAAYEAADKAYDAACKAADEAKKRGYDEADEAFVKTCLL